MGAEQLWGYIVGGVGLIIGILGWLRNNRSDAKADGVLLAELGYVKAGIDDIKRKQEYQDRQFNEYAERLAKAEASAAQAHKRIDRLEGKTS